MRKHLLIPIIAILFVTGCKTADDPAPYFDYANSYLPLKTGNSWTYLHNGRDTITSTVDGSTYTQGFQTFYRLSGLESGENYFSQYNNLYFMQVNPGSAASYAAPILDQYQSSGYTLTVKDSIAYSDDPNPPLSVMTVLSNGFSKTINGKQYEDVIHTSVDVQEAFNGYYMIVDSYDFYFARGIGIIEIDKNYLGTITDTKTIISYSVH